MNRAVRNAAYAHLVLSQWLPVSGLAAAIVLAIAHGGPSALDLALFGVFWLPTLIGIEVGYHRFLSHRAFRAHRAFEAFLVIAGSMSFQGPGLWWAAVHRTHHKLADRTGDPHSPHLHGGGLRGWLAGFWHAHWAWNRDAYEGVRDNAPWKPFVPDLLAERWLCRINRGYMLWLAAGLVLPAAIGGIASGSAYGALTGFLWGACVRLFAVNQAINALNSLCHAFGSRPFGLHCRDRSTNLWLLAIPTFGASFHHNHHVFPGSATTRIEWWQLDPGGILLAVLERLGVVWDRGSPSASDPAWRRRVVARVGDRVASLSGLSERSAFVDLGLPASRYAPGERIELRQLAATDVDTPVTELDAVVERVSWQGVNIAFESPALGALRRGQTTTSAPSGPAIT